MINRYLDEIEHPMDFGTMMTKLNEGQYETMEELKKDVELVFKIGRAHV